MVVSGEPNINNIMGGIENTGGVRLHNHRKKLKQRFDIIKKLGQGTYGKVQLGINKETGQEVAIKTIKKSKIETEADLIRIRREIQIMSSVQHPNIIHIYEVFENREKMILVMEYAAGGELYDYLSERKVLAEEEARRIFRQIATACYYCHKHKICHRDLKLENILLDENGNAKIADFGLSNIFDDQRLLSTYCGSPLYASPEIVKGTPYQGPEVDCWSLGVLLYTLVYGAMPFDGSNFKRLVKQISQGDYFEPKKPSRASPLIREMLTVNPKHRANIEKICSHWWVNEGYEDNCLEISEELANQTPVRLDLLLSLAPPPPQLESEKLVVTGEIADESSLVNENLIPTRSQSVGSLRELSHTPDRRIKDLLAEEAKSATKRKLETTVSSDQANLSQEGVRRKEKIIKERTVADITEQAPVKADKSTEDASMAEAAPLDKSSTRTISKKMDIDNEENVDPSALGAACAEIIEEAKKNEAKKIESNKEVPSIIKTKDSMEKKNETVTTPKNGEIKEEKPSVEEPQATEKKETSVKDLSSKDKENEKKVKKESKVEESKIPAKKKIIKKKVLTDKNENLVSKPEEKKEISTEKAQIKQDENLKPAKQDEKVKEDEKIPDKPVERRHSKIFETAEKFQNLISSNEKMQPSIEKPKKIVIPGVNVGGFKKEFERKASLTSNSSVPQLKNSLSKKTIEKQGSTEQTEETRLTKTEVPKVAAEEKSVDEKKVESEEPKTVQEAQAPKTETPNIDEERKKKAVSIISSALDKEGARKSKSRPCVGRKPPIPFGSSGRSASGNIGIIPAIFDVRKVEEELQSPKTAQVVEEIAEEVPEESKVSSAEITLKSATLPRRKTTKAEINLKYPTPKPAVMEFKTEMAHRVEPPPVLPTQRSEVTFPVSPPAENIRSLSLEAPTRSKQSRERIIPISFEKDANTKEAVSSPPVKPPVKVYQTQRSSVSQRSESLSRQSTQESDSETTSVKGEPIRKSPREYIIPIAVEGGGYVTPRAGSLEPSETTSTTSTMTNRSKFGRARRMSSLLNDREGSEDESPFARPNSFSKDSDNEDSRKDLFRMHSLRSSRPRKATLEHNDSFSSGEDDDDDGFEILTAENLFSTLLSRARELTSRLNVDEGRLGFPRSSLLSSNFFNFPNRLETLSRRSPLGRAFSREQSADSSPRLGTPWRRSVTRDLGSDINRVFNSSKMPTHTASLPRGDKNRTENLNLLDLDLKNLKLSKEDALALSYLTPGLSRRIQKQLLAQLPPSEARKLSRTLSMRESASEDYPKYGRPKMYDASADRSSTLPRRFSVTNNPLRYRETSIDRDLNSSAARIPENPYSKYEMPKAYESTVGIQNNSRTKINELALPTSASKSSLPIRSPSRDYYSPFSDRTISKYEDEPQKLPSDTVSDVECSPLEKYRRRRAARSASLKEPKTDYLLPKPTPFVPYHSPDSSISESLPSKSDNNYFSSKNDNFMNESSSKLNVPETGHFSRFLSPSRHDMSDHSDSERSKDQRRVSRFLRPDFFDPPKEEITNPYLREKKEREMETQKVLKEIRDKRKNKMRERSASRERRKTEVNEKSPVESLDKNIEDSNKNSNLNTKTSEGILAKSTENLLKTVSDNIKNLESSVKNIHDYVNLKPEDFTSNSEATISAEGVGIHDYINLPNSNNLMNAQNEVASTDSLTHDYVNIKANENEENIPKKERISKIARPKSYPAENISKKYTTKIPTVTENDPKTKISKLRKPEKREKGKETVVEPVKKESIDKQNEKEPAEKSKEKQSSRKTEEKDKSKERSKSKEKEAPKKLKYDGEKSSSKSKLLQSIEKKFEKLRSFNNSPTTNVEENKAHEKKSSVENTIKRLREQTVPSDNDTCITESGLIKRAVSVEDFPSLGAGVKNLQTSKKSVTKILNLFKKYEEKENKRNNKPKSKESTSTAEDNKNKEESKAIETITEKTDNFNDKIVGANTVMSNNCPLRSESVSPTKHIYQNVTPKQEPEKNDQLSKENIPAKDGNEKKAERPHSLFIEKMKHFQKSYAGAKSDSLINDKIEKKASKLPVNSFRRSLNLENSNIEPPKFYKTPTVKPLSTIEQNKEPSKGKESIPKELGNNYSKNMWENRLKRNEEETNSNIENVGAQTDESVDNKVDRKKLHLDFSKIPSYTLPKITIEPNTSSAEEKLGDNKENRNSLATTDDSSAFLSPYEDVDHGNDSWSVCSDYHTNDLTSPVSPTGQFYSADEGESVIDRIRRKSFYTRFNEKKRPRKSSFSSYKDLDVYKNLGYRNPGYRSPTNYGTLDQKSTKREPSFERKVYYQGQEPIKMEYRDCKENAFANHGYVNIPRYNTYNPRLGRTSCYSMDEEGVLMDTSPAAGRSKMYSYLQSPSKFSTRSISPNSESTYSDAGSSMNQNISNSPTSTNLL